MSATPLKCVLFDLDGTLLDTAPDLAFALNTLLQQKKLLPLALETIRPHASHGGKALLKLGFSIDDTHADYAELSKTLLTIYRENICIGTQLFPGMQEVLDYLLLKKIHWGVVTNKPAWLTEPLLKQLNLFEQAACVISGDTLTKRKPDPAPLLHACEIMGCAPSETIYFGDAERDIQAAKNAGIKVYIAKYGYLDHCDVIDDWRADGCIETPSEIIKIINDRRLC